MIENNYDEVKSDFGQPILTKSSVYSSREIEDIEKFITRSRKLYYAAALEPEEKDPSGRVCFLVAKNDLKYIIKCLDVSNVVVNDGEWKNWQNISSPLVEEEVYMKNKLVWSSRTTSQFSGESGLSELDTDSRTSIKQFLTSVLTLSPVTFLCRGPSRLEVNSMEYLCQTTGNSISFKAVEIIKMKDKREYIGNSSGGFIEPF